MTAYEDWVARAKSVPIEREIERRGIVLRGRIEREGPCPVCGGTDRFSINTAKQVFNCRGCSVGGDIIALVAHLDGCDFNQAVEMLAGESMPKPNGGGRRTFGRNAAPGNAAPRDTVVAEYKYQDETGAIILVTERHEFVNWDGTRVLKNGKVKKTFRQRRPDPDQPGQWLYNAQGVPAVPYKLPLVMEAIAANQIILIVEGEAKCDLLATWNIAATCCVGGAGKWHADHSQHLRGADVVLVPDNDGAGFKHIQDVGAALAGIAKRVRVLLLPDLPQKGDILDWQKAGGTREMLDQLLEQAPDWQPITDNKPSGEARAKAEADETKLIEALARMRPGIEFARRRKEAAKELGVPGSAIDAEIERTREDKADAPLYGHWRVDPWPEVVEGDSLLRDIIRRIRRHVVCSHDDALTIALWNALAWVHDDVAVHSPMLAIISAEPECGKSTTMGLISFLLPRCIASVDISEAALYRAIRKWQPSFAIDEFDKALVSDDKAGLCAVINSGHVKGSGVIRCIGDDRTPELFSTFCPKAIGMIGRRLPDATRTRCITVELRRKKHGERVEKFKHEDDAGLGDLRRRLARWAIDNADKLRAAEPLMPAGMENRVADNWLLQFRIADLCGEDWGEQARAAALALERKVDNRTAGVHLLADIKALFDAEPDAKCMFSGTVVTKLTEDAGKLWVEFSKGKPLTQNRLARMLAAYGIAPQTVWPTSERSGKGYYRHQFEDAWERYLPDTEAPPREDSMI
jgi:Protein of unknown function (DUF3631)/CHC2 zinc finger